MKKNVNEKKRLKLHAENRNNVVSELQRAYVKYLSELGNFTSNLSKTDGNSYSCAVEDLLIDMTRKELQGCNDSDNRNCYRCKHLLNVSRTFEKISDDTEECVADLNFVQSIVWLRSAILFMKTIPVEQFHLVFYKQWKNTEKDFHSYNQDSSRGIEENNYGDLISPLNNQKSDANFDDDSEFLNSIDFLYNEKYSTSYTEQINQETEIFSQKRNNPSVFTSFQSLERFFNVQTCTQQGTAVNNYIVQDSDKEYTSGSDMFRDSLESESNINEKDNELLEESDLINEKSADKLSLFSESSDTLKITSVGTKDDLAIPSGDNNFLDITLSNESSLSYEQNCSQLREQLTSESNKPIQQTCDSIFRNEIPIISPNQINNFYSPKDDSAYDTYQLSIERTSRICEGRDSVVLLSQKIDNITPYEKEDIPNDMHKNNWISKRNSFSSQSENNKTVKSCSQRYKNLIENAEYEENCNKRKKLKSVHELTVSKTSEREVRNISSEWLKFTLDTLNVDDIAFQSMKMILAVLQNEKIAKQYMRKRCWKNTLEEQAVNAILDYCDVSEAENKTNVYTQEIVQVVTGMLDKSMETVEFNKVTMLTHQISIILQLCISIKVCIEVINYLTIKLKSYENVLITLINNKKADVHKTNQFEEDVIPPVVDLWKKQLNFEGEIVEDSRQTRERRWLMILSDFTLVAMENFVQFAKKSQKLVSLLS
ncbi:hypothetical protein K0M31_013164 [Melipona bicolor]|uniref:Uncharacterized protein n=1 Tax=Melipona bicolor TaxID=60889 RepID=A0AA40FIS3_9HYME|nr:hypothetical protein K0M31_013164 [Melipona bicolor]